MSYVTYVDPSSISWDRLMQGIPWPTIGRYSCDHIVLTAPLFQARARAAGKEEFAYAAIAGGYLDPGEGNASPEPHFTTINKVVLNFSRLFQKGHDLERVVEVQPRALADRLDFSVQSAQDLYSANEALKASVYQYFSDQIGSLNQYLKYRLTQTRYLSPLFLSQMTKGDISVEEALLIIACLGLFKNTTKEKELVCDPYTGMMRDKIQLSMLGGKQPRKLIFLDPNELSEKIQVPDQCSFEDRAYDHTRTLFEGTKVMVVCIMGILGDFSLTSRNLLDRLIGASADHRKVCELIDHLEDFFPDVAQEQIDACRMNIKKETHTAFQMCEELVSQLLKEKDLHDVLGKLEARYRLQLAAEQKDELQRKFEKHKDVILEFLKIALSQYQISNPKKIQIHWNVRGITVLENMEVTKTCAVSRRVLCPQIAGGNREDLVYSSDNDKDETVVSRWKSYCQQYRLSDAEMASFLLNLFAGRPVPCLFEDEAVPQALLPFLSFLMVLLLGKEPAYDSASHAANFILLWSVKLRIKSFEDALKAMPLIPEGAIAAKQFMLHVSDAPLDAISRTQYKDPKRIPKSGFLPALNTFLGPARDWIQKYDDVVTVAIECCRVMLFPQLRGQAADSLRDKLKKAYETTIEIWEIPFYLSTFAEMDELVSNPNHFEIEENIRCKKTLAWRYLKDIGVQIENQDHVVQQCLRLLSRDIPFQDDNIQQLFEIIHTENNQAWKGKMSADFRRMDLDDAFLSSLRGMLDSWKVAIWEDFTVDTGAKIIRYHELWNGHFSRHMNKFVKHPSFQKVKEHCENNVFFPFNPHRELSSALHPEAYASDDDPIAEWAINFMMNRHPINRG